MSGDPLPEGSWGKQCDPETGICFNGAKTVWCAGNPDTGGCYGGGVGLYGIGKLTRPQIHASSEKFYGPWERDNNKAIIGLKLMSTGMLDAAGLQPGDVITAIGKFNFNNEAQRNVILNWRLRDPVLNITFLRNGELMSSQFDNPYKV